MGMGTVQTAPTPPQKPIRFVNNEGHPPAKRRRVTAACRTCRKRKTRCDGQRPLCLTCSDNGHECLGYADNGECSEGPTAVEAGHDGSNNGRTDNTISVSRHETPTLDPSLQKANGNTSRSVLVDTRSRTIGNGEVESNAKPQTTTQDDNTTLSTLSERHRVPYFRYFGPTAIVPGFKQMVVSVREHRPSTGTPSSASISSPGSNVRGLQSVFRDFSNEANIVGQLPAYDLNDDLPTNEFIIHLVETFFAHLGCNYPFLRKVQFIKKVQEKTAEPILVDAVCALAARFSDHSLLSTSHRSSLPKSEYGHGFGQRAKAAVVETFPCPSVAAVQACLLLAYEGFGAAQDSALWMYLGCAIRMAIDLGLQKLDGVKHQGIKDPGYRPSISHGDTDDLPESISEDERNEVEQERIDTLWTVFMLDRVISSGTGRPATMRDDDIELKFPTVQAAIDGSWPSPFPALIQTIHLYGRVSDLLNNIKNVSDVTPKKIEGLAEMEKDLTRLYQRLDQKLTFNATNFQYYCKSGEGTNFILLHFWFHTLIMLLHQPTLMHSFEDPILQLLPNSRELSMSSAKTIADILSFAELIDIRSFIGNPFTSQPMYIAACAFLMESAAQSSSHPSSRAHTPKYSEQRSGRPDPRTATKNSEQKQRHSLLAAAANQNYQRCYKALQQLEAYWAGTRYILVALDQKAKGIWDPETFTEQEYESAKGHDAIPAWRRKLSLAAQSPASFPKILSPRPERIPGSPSIDPAQAIGWSLTGTTNSPSSNLTFMFPHAASFQPPSTVPAPVHGNMIYDPIRGSLPESTAGIPSAGTLSGMGSRYVNPTSQQPSRYTSLVPNPATTSEAEMLLELQSSPYVNTTNSQTPYSPSPGIISHVDATQHRPSSVLPFSSDIYSTGVNTFGTGDMMMESQQIDISSMGDDMIPWLEYLPQDVLGFFDNNNTGYSVELDVASMGSGGL